MSYLEDLKTRRETVAAELAEMNKKTMGGKPNAMSADGGTSVDHTRHRLSLYEELEKLDKLILENQRVEEAIEDGAGGFSAWEIHTPLS